VHASDEQNHQGTLHPCALLLPTISSSAKKGAAMRRAIGTICGVSVILVALTTCPGVAYESLEGRVKLTSRAAFTTFAAALKQAITQHKLGLVCHANAQAGAASVGKTIPGNQVLMVYRPDFAIRMLAADVEAGFEAPIRLYIYENADGSATLSYVKPSTVFKPYQNAALDQLAAELDALVEAIVRAAMGAS
jgi:uncharacterized protein (DUF302 family)